MSIEIKKLAPELADDYLSFMGGDAFADNADWAGCYCMHYHYEKAFEDEPGITRAGKAREYILAGRLTGYLAYSDGRVVGWVNANDKRNYANLNSRWKLAELGERVKSVVCFLITPQYRAQGVATALLERVCADAELEGCDCVEGYPTVGAEFNSRHYHGSASMYEKQGFEVYKQLEGEQIVQKRFKR